MDAYPSLRTCARLQREADWLLYRDVIRPRHDAEMKLTSLALCGPNLLIETGPIGSDDRALFPVLCLKAG